MSGERRFASVLLAGNFLPGGEGPFDPATEEGACRVAEALIESLIDHWDDTFARGVEVPLLLLAAPGYDKAVLAAMEHPIAARYGGARLCCIGIPGLHASGLVDVPGMMGLIEVRRRIDEWLAQHQPEVVVAKPFTSYGARLDLRVMEYVARQASPLPPNVRSGPQEASDVRPTALEVVPFAGADGPVLGLYTGGDRPRPVVMPTAEWQAAGYAPQPADEQATGTVYLHLPGLREHGPRTADGMTPFEAWGTGLLLSLATRPWAEQPSLFEEGLRDLALQVMMRPIRCPSQRGLRGFRRPLVL